VGGSYLSSVFCISPRNTPQLRGILKAGQMFPLMQSPAIRRLTRGTPALAALMFVLSFAVFAWGLHYKLSLYHSPAVASASAPAKLLSAQERTATRTQVWVQDDVTPIPTIFLAFLLALIPACEQLFPVTRACVRCSETPLLGPLFRRPPPSIRLYA
jgi:hypothetical protein